MLEFFPKIQKNHDPVSDFERNPGDKMIRVQLSFLSEIRFFLIKQGKACGFFASD